MIVRPIERHIKTIQISAGDVVVLPVPVQTASVTVLHKRVGDADAYTVTGVEIVSTSNTITRKGYRSESDQTIVDKTYTAVVDKVLRWTVSSTDTAVSGIGNARIVCRDDSQSVIRAQSFRTIVRGADDYSKTVPGEAEAWAATIESAAETAASEAIASATSTATTAATTATTKAAEASASATQAAQSATQAQADVTAETAARTAADAILTAQAQSLTRSLDFLWKLNRGISYTFETDETAAYSKTVPTGAKVCDVRSVGGHSEVIDGEIVSADVTAIDIVRADDSTTIQIPAAVRALEGYGWSAGTVFNEVDFANKKFIKRVDKVDLGECTWGHNGTNADGSTQFITRSVEDRALSTNGICDIFPIGNTVDGYINLRINSYAFTANTSGYTSPTVFRTAMSGHYLYYELATPVETDISALLTDSTEDIEVESGGSITMVQDGTQLSVPSKVEYLIALNEVET